MSSQSTSTRHSVTDVITSKDAADPVPQPGADARSLTVGAPSVISRQSRLKQLWSTTLGGATGLQVVSIMIILVAWQLAAVRDIFGRESVPTPWGVVEQAVEDAELFPRNIQTTFFEAGLGFAYAMTAGIVVALVIFASSFLNRALSGLMVTLYATPGLAIAPVLGIMFAGTAPKIALAALGAFFPIVVGMSVGLRSADRIALDVVRSIGGGWWAELWKVRVRYAIPGLAVGMRIAAPAALIGATLGEFLGGERGLGVMLIVSMTEFNVERTWVIAAVLTLSVWSVDSLFAALARLLSKGVEGASDTTQPIMSRPSRAMGRMVATARATGTVIMSALVVVLAWIGFLELFSVNPFFGKGPSDVWEFLFRSPNASQNRSLLSNALGETLPLAGLGFAVGAAAALAAAVICRLFTPLEPFLIGFARLLQAIPLIALTPILVIMFGRGSTATIVVATLITFFPSLIAAMQGLKGASAAATDVFRSYDAGRVARLVRLDIPTALPLMFAAARLAAPRALLGVLIAEYLATGRGIGFLVTFSRENSNFAMVWSAMVAIALVSVTIYSLIQQAERRVFAKYAPSHQS